MGTLKKGLVAAGGVGAVAAGVAFRRRNGHRGGDRVGRPRRVSWLGRLLDPTGGPSVEPPVPPQLPEGRTAIVPGRGEMFYRTAGSGSESVPVVLLHGWMASADMNWFRVYDAVAARHPVVAPDLRGHGRGIRAPHRFSLEDCADDAAALLRHLGIDRAVAVGYSMGGPVATLLWRRHPELVAGLVLEATALEWRASLAERMRWRTMGVLGVLLRWHTGRMLLFRLTGGGADVPDDLLGLRTWLEGEFRRADWTDIADAGRAIGGYDARPFAGEVDVPTAVVITTRDSMVPVHKQEALAAALGSRVFTFDGDHDSAVLGGDDFAAVTLEAVEAVSRT